MRRSKNRWLPEIKSALSKSRSLISLPLKKVFSRSSIDDEFYEELEEILIQADVGLPATTTIIDGLRQEVRKVHPKDVSDVRDLLIDEIVRVLDSASDDEVAKRPRKELSIHIIVGVNGAGKTTSIAKLASRFKGSSQKVIVAAADTYRAAAVEQLEIWVDRIGVDMVKHRRGSDAAAVVFDSIRAAKGRQANELIVDTAGRLHTKTPLMEEIKKVKRVVDREAEGAFVETLLVIDATTGQNGLSQAKLFNEALDIDGIILAKLDGTAKGGIVLAITKELGIPVLYVGTGEAVNDLADFNSRVFTESLLS